MLTGLLLYIISPTAFWIWLILGGNHRHHHRCDDD
jgi:hypothetical protein